jgi:hypothetical protein
MQEKKRQDVTFRQCGARTGKRHARKNAARIS